MPAAAAAEVVRVGPGDGMISSAENVNADTTAVTVPIPKVN